MKTVNKICQILATLFGLASLVMFFMQFATFTINGNEEGFIGAVLAFGASKKLAGGVTANMAVSADILFCFILTAIGFLMSVFSFKKKGLRYAAPAFGIVPAVYMLVIALSDPLKFIDARATLSGKTELGYTITGLEYTPFVLITAIALFVFTALAVAYLLIDDSIEVAESKGAKKPILKRIVLFFRDYKSEVKKIVWPGYKEVIRNTIIVLVMCLIVGAFIWLLDFGLGNLIKLILGISK